MRSRTADELPTGQAAFWHAFLAATGRPAETLVSDVFSFADSEAAAAELAALVLVGTKVGTASLVWTYEREGDAVPKAGDLSLVTSFAGAPLCVIETTAVAIRRFDQVPADFAASEGEGDLSLAYWRDVHWAYFGRECRAMGREPDPSMPVVCETFAVLYSDQGPRQPTAL